MITSKPFYVLQYNDMSHKNVRGTFPVVTGTGMWPVSSDPLHPKVTRFLTRKDAQKYCGDLFRIRKVSATYVLGE